MGRKLQRLEPAASIAGVQTPSRGSPGSPRAAVTSAFGNAVRPLRFPSSPNRTARVWDVKRAGKVGGGKSFHR